MAEESNKDQSTGQSSTTTTAEKKDNGVIKKQQRGLLSRMWRGIFRADRDDFEKRLRYISKEEAAVMSRIKKRTQAWRRLTRNFLMFSVVFELVAVGYAITTTRSLDLNWKMRAARVLPMFLLPALSYLTYSALVTFTRMRDRRDQKTLEMLRAERQAKIDELKERTNYYTTQQLIQRYDPDPAAKAAAATFLASKMGADSGLKVQLGDESKVGKSNDVELVQSSGLRNRKQMPPRSSSTGSSIVMHHHEETHGYAGTEGGPGPAPGLQNPPLLVVDHHDPRSSASNDGGWIARLAALLVGEDPTQSYALICGNCHMHNGLAMKEDYPFVTYYCPHCHALNRSKQSSGDPISGTNSPTNLIPLPAVAEGDVSSCVSDSGVVTAADAAEIAADAVETATVVPEEEEPTVT